MRQRRFGFSLVELLVVIAIIGALVAFLLPTLSNARKNARAAECMAQLREMFIAQNFYADDNRGQYVVSQAEGGAHWEVQLEKYLTQRSGDRGRIYECPSVPPERQTIFQGSYGVTTCLTHPFWNAQRHRKMDAARIIFMGDKDLNGEDFLRSHDGMSFTRATIEPYWISWIGHSGVRSFRHGKNQLANMVMADGHVEAMGAEQLMHASGAWYSGSDKFEVQTVTGCGCN